MRGNGFRHLFAVPDIQWDSNPYCPYGYKAVGKFLWSSLDHEAKCVTIMAIKHTVKLAALLWYYH